MCESKLGKLMQAFRADRPDEWTMDEFIGMAEQMHKEIELLRQAEKDAARYRWLRQQPCSGWEVDGDETSHIDVTMWRNDGFGESLSGDQMDAAIDEAMRCNK